MTHQAFFGDGDKTFDLPGNLIMELERQTHTGIGQLCKRVFGRDFMLNDLVQIIRLGLIGAGMSPKDAADLMAAYADKTPIVELFPLAVAVLETKFFGSVTAAPDQEATA
jgi:hypothetical protein